jgi:Tfp pilus assembly protein PilF
MLQETFSLRRIFHRFFPKRALQTAPVEKKGWEHLSTEQKKELALQMLIQGEFSLLRGHLGAISLFEAAVQLDPQNATLWYRQGLAFFEYGSEEGKEKTLLLACKQFKIATQLDPHLFDGWVAWGNALLQLGRFHEEHHFHLEAKAKYQRAMDLSQGQSKEALHELHWDFGIVQLEIASQSGEALDYHLSIQTFQEALEYEPSPPAEFWNDLGNAYLQLGLLINDQRYFLNSAEMFQKAVKQMPHYFDGWLSLAGAYGQLYLNSMDERFAAKASDCYATAARLFPRSEEVWLHWAALLAETGRLNKNIKPLFLSVEKCARAASLLPDEIAIVGQWVESLSHLGALSGRLDLLIEAEQKIIKAVDQCPDDPDLWHAYGICLLSFAKYYEDPDYDDLAIEKLQYGLSLDRTSAELWHALGLAHKHAADLTDEMAMIERAPRFFSKAMDLKPSCPCLTFDTAAAWLHYSEALHDLEALEQSIALFEALLQQNRAALLHHPEWLFEYASALDWLGEFSGEERGFLRAIEVFSHVLLIEPDYPGIHLKIAMAYTQMGHLSGDSEYYKKALLSFRLAAVQEEENDSLWLEWGLCLIHLAHHTIDTQFMDQLYLSAEQKISKAGQLGHPSAYYNLACLQSILGQTEAALHLIQKALSLKALPPIEELLEDEWLEALRATPQFAHFLNALEAKLQAREQ